MELPQLKFENFSKTLLFEFSSFPKPCCFAYSLFSKEATEKFELNVNILTHNWYLVKELISEKE